MTKKLAKVQRIEKDDQNVVEKLVTREVQLLQMRQEHEKEFHKQKMRILRLASEELSKIERGEDIDCKKVSNIMSVSSLLRLDFRR